jgi:Tfp pilus assembly protein PilP
MKLMTSILTAAMMTGGAWAQNPNIINNVQNKMDAVEQQKTADSNAALGITGSSAQASKPAPGAPAPAVKPATIPGSKPATATKPADAPSPKATASSTPNRLERVNVVRHADDIQIEISPREAVTPRVSKLSSPTRVVVELPATAMATAQSKIAVGSAGVKGVRIGMDGKTPPTTSVVVDLEQAYGYDMAPGPGNTLVLTLHTQQAAAKSASAPAAVKTSSPAPKAQAAAAKPIVAAPAGSPKAAKLTTASVADAPKVAKAATLSRPAPKEAKATPASSAPKATAGTVAAQKPAAKSAAASTTKIAAQEKPGAAGKTAEAAKPKPEEKKKWAMNGKRDPFFSPVVQQSAGSGCSTGKKCLEIGQINLRGVVKAEAGFIAVVTNSLNKAYFLHENDPVFNGYVVRITGDSVVFQETVQDKLGKPLTREVTKKITTPAV